MIPTRKHTNLIAPDENPLLSKISEITNLCDNSKNMLVNIYLIKKDYFVYCNSAFKKIVGGNCKKLYKGGWNFWFSLIDLKDTLQVKKKIVTFFSTPYSPDSFILKYHISNIHNEKVYIKHEIILYKMEKQIIAVSYIYDITKKEKIELYFKELDGQNGSRFSKDHRTKISSREKEVLKLVADGFSSKQIADRLFISNHTAISHRKNLIEKFNVRNTAQLIKRASRNIELW